MDFFYHKSSTPVKSIRELTSQEISLSLVPFGPSPGTAQVRYFRLPVKDFVVPAFLRYNIKKSSPFKFLVTGWPDESGVLGGTWRFH